MIFCRSHAARQPAAEHAVIPVISSVSCPPPEALLRKSRTRSPQSLKHGYRREILLSGLHSVESSTWGRKPPLFQENEQVERLASGAVKSGYKISVELYYAHHDSDELENTLDSLAEEIAAHFDNNASSLMIRRSLWVGRTVDLLKVVSTVCETMKGPYPGWPVEDVKRVLVKETELFNRTLTRGERVISKIKTDVVTSEVIHDLLSTHGIPPDLSVMILKEKGHEVDMREWEDEVRKHSERSK